MAAALTAQKIIGATTLTVDSTAEWPTATAVHFTMFKIDANNTEIANTRTDWKGIVASSTSITNLTLQAGTDIEYPIGSKVICAPTAAWADDLVEGLLVSHDQDGTLKADAVDVTAVIKDGVITNAKLVDGTITEAKTNTKPSEFLSDFIASGGVVAQSAGLVGTFSNIVYYIGGVRYTATSVPNKTYTASKDTYVDINSSGTPTYTEVANNAASPALTAGYIRVAKVVTNGSAITSVVQSGTDSLGNPIYGRSHYLPGSPVVSYVATAEATSSTSGVDLATVQSVTTVIGRSGMAFVSITHEGGNSGTDAQTLMSFAASGANTIATGTYNTRSRLQTATATQRVGTTKLLTGLNPGVTTFTAKFFVTSGTGTFSNREISVIPL